MRLLKKIISKILIILFAIILLTSNNCLAKDEENLDVKGLINQEEGSLFDKTIAKTIRRVSTSCL